MSPSCKESLEHILFKVLYPFLWKIYFGDCRLCLWHKSFAVLFNPNQATFFHLPSAAAVPRKLYWCYKFLSLRKGTRGGAYVFSNLRESHRETKHINTSHRFELVKAKVLSPKFTGPRKKIKEINGMQIVKEFTLNSELLTEEGNSTWNFIVKFYCISNLTRVEKKSIVSIIPEKRVLFPI